MNAEANCPAFPVVVLNSTSGEICAQYFGATLRDFFAAKAMEAILQCDFPSKIPDKDTGLTVGEYVAKKAYTMADAMLAEREKGN